MVRASRILVILALGVLLLGTPSLVRADPALGGFSGGTLFATYAADGDTVGWQFSVNRSVVVTHLGFWDGDAGTGSAMLNSHAVGLWNASGSLLTSNIVSPSSPFTGAFRYEPTANVTIPAGTYVLGAYYPAANTIADGYLTSTTGITMAAGFTMLNTARDPDGAPTDLVFPNVFTAPGGRFGPNLLFSEVPEPASIGLAGAAAAAIVVRRRRR